MNEGCRLWGAGDRLRHEGCKLMGAGYGLCDEGDRLWIAAVNEVHGNVKINWTKDGCVVEGETFKETT